MAPMMGYLYMAGAAMSFVTLAFAYRWSEERKANRLVMSAAMGATTALLAVLFAAAVGADLRQADAGHFLFGSALGLIDVVLIPVFMAAVARGDLSITWTLLTLSFALPSLLVLIYPGEHPTRRGLAGLVLAALAVALLGVDTIRRHRGGGPGTMRKGWALFMAISFVLNGSALYTLSLATSSQPDPSWSNTLAFTLMSGAVFAAGTLVMALAKRRPGSVRPGLLIGAVAGTASGAGILFCLLGLSHGVPGYILYPATNGGSSVIVVVLSVFLLKERPGPCGWVGIAAGAAALTLIAMAA
jgi:drug/metabolite transporter (DMT)-like permease